MRLLRSKNRIWIVSALAAALLLSGCGAMKPAAAPAATGAPTYAPTAAPADTPEPTGGEVLPATPAPLPATPAPVPTDAPTGTGGPATPMPTPAVENAVDDSYFADAAFLGNSLMDGLRLFGGLRYGDFYSGTSASVISVNLLQDAKNSAGEPCTRMEALLEKQYRKVYVIFGINELAFEPESFAEIYAELLAQIAAGEPNALIYVLSLTPITQERDAEDDVFTRERILQYNAAIAEMAVKNGYIYLDLYDALVGEDGWLPEAQSTDGIHFKPSKYVEWANFLRTHFETDDAAEVTAD